MCINSEEATFFFFSCLPFSSPGGAGGRGTHRGKNLILSFLIWLRPLVKRRGSQ